VCYFVKIHISLSILFIALLLIQIKHRIFSYFLLSDGLVHQIMYCTSTNIVFQESTSVSVKKER